MTIELELPPGVTAEGVGARRAELASALLHPLNRVWLSCEDRLRIHLGDNPMAPAMPDYDSGTVAQGWLTYGREAGLVVEKRRRWLS